MLRTWRSWSPFIPPALYLIGLLLHVRVNDLVGTLMWFAMYAFYGWLLIPLVWSTIKASPGILRLRSLRFVIVGTVLVMAACVGLAIAYIITGSSSGVVQMTLVVFAGVGFATIFVALFGGLLGASKRTIERYRAGN